MRYEPWAAERIRVRESWHHPEDVRSQSIRKPASRRSLTVTEIAMTWKFRPLLRAAVCCAVLVFSSISLVSSTPTERSCDTLKRWAAPYRDTSPTLDALARFDRGHRRAIFNAIRPDARAALWREQLDRFSRSPQLSDAQRALVREGIALTTPALYAGDKVAAAALAAFWTRVHPAFDRKARAYWLVLGAGLAAPAAAAVEDWCGCNDGYGWFECESGLCPGGGCDEWLGCGPNWGHSCNGKCVQ
jgi:hypothetical protein